jgi:hypothetical protein
LLKEIRIKVDKKTNIDDIILHALNIGYCVDLSKEKYYLAAEYLLLDSNQCMKWCNEAIYITALSYEEMTAKEFMEYRRK